MWSQQTCCVSSSASDVVFSEVDKRVEESLEGTHGKVGVKEGERKASIGRAGAPHQQQL